VSGFLVSRFLADERGATAIEYGLICSLIFIVIITAVTSFGNTTSGMILNIANAISAAG
jgi:pilus assembly protein Flp/PilA